VWSTILPSGLALKRRAAKDLAVALNTEPNPTKNHLSSIQQLAYEQIVNSPKPILLSGITGSGKTHIYEKLIIEQLNNNASVLFVSPEIFLTQQLFSRLERTFQGAITMTHSGLTTSKRRNIWLDTLSSDRARLYIGPRSSLFLPFTNLGLIIVDEAHDSSYKQESSPRYVVRDVAARLATLTGAKLILGSATPEAVTVWLAQKGRLETVSINSRHANSQLPQTRLIDTKHHHSPLSGELIAAISDRLERNEQCLLLHNKRGSARRLSCDDCGANLLCPHCDTNLVFHADEGRLRCHSCGYHIFPPSICPSCKSQNLRFFGYGTKQLVQEVETRFNHARIARIDRDEARKNTLSNILGEAEAGRIDIIIGTQMIAKGLDFAKVTLAGIIDGDDLLGGDDFQSRERGVSLIIQASGRSGRAKLSGEVLIQTRQPDNPLWPTILKHNWSDFIQNELKRREHYLYPPFCYLARASFRAASQTVAENLARDWMANAKLPPHTNCLGPAIPNRSKLGSTYIANLIFKSSHRTELTKLIHLLPRDTTLDIDPISIF
jgi:primosomal protein N' (replication factor Y)